MNWRLEMHRTKRNSGLAITRLIIILVIAGLIVAIGVPAFLTWQVSNIQKEAKETLRTLKTKQTFYKYEKNEYAKSIEALGYQPDSEHFTYSTDGKKCTATGKANTKVAGNVWIIDLMTGKITETVPIKKSD
jgi:type II secretory pathway pseudopilin PulG